MVTVLASRLLSGAITSEQVIGDARWASVFLANFHFTATGTNYFFAQGPPSPLQSFWSLAVEEQFYIVYPTIFLVVATIGRRMSLRAKLGVVPRHGRGGIVHVVDRPDVLNPTVAYFSPFTRAWELALGALVAVVAGQLRRMPPGLAAVMTWVGMAGIVGSRTRVSRTPPPIQDRGWPCRSWPQRSSSPVARPPHAAGPKPLLVTQPRFGGWDAGRTRCTCGTGPFS